MPVIFQGLIIKYLAKKNHSDFVEGCIKRGVGVVGRGVGIGCLMGGKYLKEFRNTTENFEYIYNICDGEFLLIKFFIVNGHIAQHLWVIRFP